MVLNYSIDKCANGERLCYNLLLPNYSSKIHVPPIKIQGIKTKLLPFIMESIEWNGDGVWFEPFMGSGVVGFNVEPSKALFTDTNPYIIEFYRALQENKITPQLVRKYLEEEGQKLALTPPDKTSYYYKVRSRFNKSHDPLDFLFLQRSNFNGMIRFGPNGYNVPFGRKPNRFRPALITKIVNQTAWAQKVIQRNDWKFKTMDWHESLLRSSDQDFIYLDPPYIGRNSDYFNEWTEKDAQKLVNYANTQIHGGYALSMWYKNKYRENPYVDSWKGELLTNEHFYYLGGKEINRNSVIEALVVKKGYVAVKEGTSDGQLQLF